MMSILPQLRVATLVFIGAMMASSAFAQSWPTKPVRLVVPFAAGGATDVIARSLAQKLGDIWKQSVVVDNRPGAGGGVAASLVAKSPADGYTMILVGGSQLTVNPHIYRQLPYSPSDFTIIANIARGPMVIAVGSAVPAQTLKDLVALARSRPGQLNFGSAGNGTQVHMAGEAFADAARIDLKHVPYKGEAPALNDLMGGQVQVVVGNIAAVSPFVNAGRIKALAITDKSRSPMLPEVPTATEAGVPGLEDISAWFALLVPAGTPADIERKIRADTVKALQDNELKARLMSQGMRAGGEDASQMKAIIAAESQKWARIVKLKQLSAD
ncbi:MULTISPECIES: Bug family tripartite tricarboxylate transporter substrate binding protein [Cupriavidus]|uniref:Bug family tripartite tricarboxylate transporter substrate binding protein n=1 Tax=Cupriavidus TaxID=106589 RepID=UPI00035E71D9|nr:MULTISPECIES: tripartite tricarboxylate transporter substrate binding protein [Cupriavidus]